MKSSRNAAVEKVAAQEDAERYLRAKRRFKTVPPILLTNLTQKTRMVPAFLLDVSATGMRIETNSAFHIGDAVRVDLRKLMVVGEVAHCASTSERNEIGLKLSEPLNDEQLARCFER